MLGKIFLFLTPSNTKGRVSSQNYLFPSNTFEPRTHYFSQPAKIGLRNSYFEKQIHWVPLFPFPSSWGILHILFSLFFSEDILHFSLKDPHVIDPANPTNNLYDAVDCWDEVEKVAEETIEKLLLRNVRVTDNWSWRPTISLDLFVNFLRRCPWSQKYHIDIIINNRLNVLSVWKQRHFYVGRLKYHVTIESSLVFTRNVTKKGSALGHILKVWDPEIACSEWVL